MKTTTAHPFLSDNPSHPGYVLQDSTGEFHCDLGTDISLAKRLCDNWSAGRLTYAEIAVSIAAHQTVNHI